MDKQDRKLNAISSIDDDIIEKQTQKRIELLRGVRKQRHRKRLFITIGSMAASLALIASTVLLLVTLLGKAVPIYTGMSVSDKPPTQQTTVAYWESIGEYASAGTQPSDVTGDLVNRPTPSANPFEKPISEQFQTTAGTKDCYYAKKGQDVYITVHLENPDSFEILSFTLNGKKYTNYMFEPGSDLENLVLKVNVGDAEGPVDYTIDAIKYVDGEEIKDVRMEGERTVQIGVYSEKQPTLTASEESIAFNSVSFRVTATDALGLVGLSGGKMEAVLYDGERIVSTKEISAGTTTVTFDGLVANKLYEYALIATYDGFDGEGKVAHVLYQKPFYTKAYVLFDAVSADKGGVTFSLKWASELAEHAVTSLAVYKGDVKVKELPSTATAADGLLPDNSYRLVANYTYQGTNGSISVEFKTAPLVYTVKHLLQSVDGTEYVLEKEESLTLQPGDSFAPALLVFEGFTAPAAESKQASATDENPVIEYRYARNSYAVALLNGGAQENTTLLFGAALPAPARDGHTFLGWFDVSGEKHVTMPAKALTLTARWSGELTAEDLLYTGSSEITITGLKNLAHTDIILPTYIGSGRVVAIAADAFKNCTSLKSITLPATLASVGGGAFSGCTGLEKVLFDGTLAQWCSIVFEEDERIELLPADTSQPTFYPTQRYAANPITQSGNLYLTSAPTVNVLASALTLPTGTLNGRFSFAGAPLTELIIPADATSIPFGVAAGCEDLATIRFHATNMPDFAERDDYNHMLGAGKNGAGVRILIGANVTRIPAGGIFAGAKIAAIEFAAGSVCTELGDFAFRTTNPNGMGMNFCTEITLPAGLIKIGKSALPVMKHITALTIPEGVTTIGEGAFAHAYALKELTIPESVTSMGSLAFGYTNALTTLNFNAASIDEPPVCDIFFGMGKKGTGVTITFGASVTRVPSRLFGNEWLYEESEMPTSVTAVIFAAGSACKQIGDYAFYGCSNLQSITLPEGLTEIGTKAFMHCESLSEVVLPAGLERIGGSAFADCKALREIVLPEGVTEIGVHAFAYCSALTEVHIPASLTSIDEVAFDSCNALTDVYFGGTQSAWEAFGIYLPTTVTIHYLGEG